MDIQDLIDNMNQLNKIQSGKEYNLGNLIKDLEQYKNDDYGLTEVEFDDGSIPTEFASWRGSYCELALGYKEGGLCYAHDLYIEAFNTNNSIFQGYKGGDFIMDLETPIHQANYGKVGVEDKKGNYNNKKIIGIKEEKDKLIIITRNEEE